MPSERLPAGRRRGRQTGSTADAAGSSLPAGRGVCHLAGTRIPPWQLHDLGEPMVPAGINIFPNLDHVLHKEPGLGRAPGRRRSHRSEQPLQVPGDDSRHQGFSPPAAVLPPRHELHRPVCQG